MKRLLMLIPLIFLCCLGCQQGQKVATVDVEADIQAIKDMVAEYEVAVNTSDVDRIVQLYADDAVEIRPNEPAFIGKEAIRGRKEQSYEILSDDFRENYEIKNVEVSGDLAFVHFMWSASVTLKASGEWINPKGNWIWILRKDPNVSWKAIYSIFSDEDLIFPSQVE